MPQDIRIWDVNPGDSLQEVTKAKLDFEKRLQDWLESDISIISNDFLVIGREVETDYGGFIDLLCLDRSGDGHWAHYGRNRCVVYSHQQTDTQRNAQQFLVVH